jgi:hypothetical protein
MGPPARNMKRECQLWPDAAPQYLVELDLVFKIVLADGSVRWDKPEHGNGYYRAMTEGSLAYYCDDSASEWLWLASW